MPGKNLTGDRGGSFNFRGVRWGITALPECTNLELQAVPSNSRTAAARLKGSGKPHPTGVPGETRAVRCGGTASPATAAGALARRELRGARQVSRPGCCSRTELKITPRLERAGLILLSFGTASFQVYLKPK